MAHEGGKENGWEDERIAEHMCHEMRGLRLEV